jgi:hypothetical protein
MRRSLEQSLWQALAVACAAQGRRTSNRPRLSRIGRNIALCVLGLYLGVLFILGAADNGGDAWGNFGVPPWREPFADMWSVTSGWECVRDGIDVVPRNPCDPWGRPANYPSLWMTPSPVGLGTESVRYLGVTAAVLFFVSAISLVGAASWRAGVVFALALCSPPVMLGVERGNADLVIFAAVVAALWMLAAFASPWRIAGNALLLLAAMLKLYPALAFPVLARQRGRQAMFGAALVLVGFAAYALAKRSEIEAIREILPETVFAQYGAQVGLDAAAQRLGQHVPALSVLEIQWVHRAVEGGIVVVGVAAGVLLAHSRRNRVPPSDHRLSRRERFQLDAFVAGAGIFCGTYAAAANWDYRLAFLLLALPQLLSWAADHCAPLPFARSAVGALLGTLWLSFPVPAYPSRWNDWWNTVMSYFAWEELLNWFLFAYLVGGLLVALGVREISLRWLTRSSVGVGSRVPRPS